MIGIPDPWLNQLPEILDIDFQLEILENKIQQQYNREFKIEMFPLVNHVSLLMK